ncbi:MAG TPA: hypothetical protein VFQ35_28460 [Polyangiaceae bacterium]|nr:hypothetical protein [Polyangiaceae bacterium]
MRKTSFGSEAAKPNRRPSRLFLGSVACALCVSAGLGGCSTAASCDPEIKSGTKFKVTVIKETDKSDKCHVIKVSEFSPFMVSAAQTQPTVEHPDCSVIPAADPPPQDDVFIEGCTPGKADMLSIFCEIRYPSKCDGSMTFSFVGEKDKVVDWTAPVIENVYFHIEDKAVSCLPDIANCFDEYQVKLERQN